MGVLSPLVQTIQHKIAEPIQAAMWIMYVHHTSTATLKGPEKYLAEEVLWEAGSIRHGSQMQQ